MKNSLIYSYASDGFAVVMTALQQNEVFQTIQLVLTILATLFSLLFTAIQLWNWFKKAKADGVITDEEIAEGKEIVDKGIKEAEKHSKK